MRKTTKMVAVLAAMSVMILGAATMVSADEKNGWVKEGSDWYYYLEDDKLVNAWAQDSAGLWYFLGDDAKMVTEAFVNGNTEVEDVTLEDAEYDKVYYVGKDGAMLTNRWFQASVTGGTDKNTPYYESGDDEWFYVGANGRVYGNAWVLSGSDWYFVESNGIMEKNAKVGDYYVDGKGVMITGWYQATEKDEKAENGIPDIKEDNWIYANANGKLVKTDWKKINSKWYYFGSVSGAVSTPEYVMVKGNVIIEETVGDDVESFILTSSGAMGTGWIKYDFDGNKKTTDYAYAGSDGVLYNNEVKRISNKWYYFGLEAGVSASQFEMIDEGYVLEKADDTLVYFDKESDAKTAAANKEVIYKLGSLVKTTVSK